jgi:hypothetical protein
MFVLFSSLLARYTLESKPSAPACAADKSKAGTALFVIGSDARKIHDADGVQL